MTEFEELALKKITKDYLAYSIYGHINEIGGKYGISNAEISKRIGWDPSGYNQKYNRSNDLRITTFIKIYTAIAEFIREREAEFGLSEDEQTKVTICDMITDDELVVGALFNHISAAAEEKVNFLSVEQYKQIYLKMKPFVMASCKSKKYNDREKDVYIHYLKEITI